MRSFVLDIMFEETQFSGNLRSLPTPVWLSICADGIRQQPTTPQVPATTTAHFQYPIRLVLNLPALDGYYFKTRLCTYTEDRSSVRVLANAQIALSRLLVGVPQQFTYPLLAVQNTAMELAIVSARAAISPLDLHGPGDFRGTYQASPGPPPYPGPQYAARRSTGGRGHGYPPSYR
jgi:hypothetical protein